MSRKRSSSVDENPNKRTRHVADEEDDEDVVDGDEADDQVYNVIVI